MHRFYLDSNIYQIIKTDHPHTNTQLREMLLSIRDKVLFCFSDAHLDDLRRSTPDYRDADLDWIGEFVRDHYFYRNIQLEFQFGLDTPAQAFAGKDYEFSDKMLSDPGSMMNSLFKDSGDQALAAILKTTMNSFLNQPIQIPLGEMDSANQALLQKVHPGFSESMSIREFMKDQFQFAHILDHDQKEMTLLRRHIIQYQNRDEYSWDKWKEEFNVKLKSTTVNKTFSEMVEHMLLDKQKNDLFLKISYAYNLLEIMGITQERTKKGIKQFTMSSLMTDAQHTYYAAYTDCLVTDDKGMQLKAHIVYQLFGIPTKVLSSEEFVLQRQQIYDNEETLEHFWASLKHDLNHGIELSNRYFPGNKQKVITYVTSHPYFNYFNRLQLLEEENGGQMIALYCDRHFYANQVMYRELELLTGKLLRFFGSDDEQKGPYRIDEEYNDQGLRQWTSGALRYELMTSGKSGTNLICLTIAMLAGSSETESQG